MALYDPDRHEPLSGAPWSEAAARGALERIVQDVHAAYRGPEAWWPIHPIDVSPERAEVLKPIYYGAAGVIWTLHRLEDEGFPAVGRDYRPALPALLAGHRDDNRRLAPNIGYPLGDSGILLLQARLAPEPGLEDALHEVIAANLEHPALGFVGGGAGSMLTALLMFERTGEDRWRDLYLHGFQWLWSRWDEDPQAGCRLWTMDFRGRREKWSGGLHGWPAIVSGMLQGRRLLSQEQGRELERRARESLHATALREDGFANWRLLAGEAEVAGPRPFVVQHCWGAPGMVNCLASLPHEPETDALLADAGALIWTAGPLAKLPGLCHGAAGNGYAFLKLHRRTGEAVWLERARAFAMHAIGQADRGVEVHGQRKFSLWTGDLGLACYLWDCIRADDRFPTLDYFF